MILQPPAANSGRISVPCVTSQKAGLIRSVETDQLQCFPLHHLDPSPMLSLFTSFPKNKQIDIWLTSAAAQGRLPTSRSPPGSHWSISRRNDTCKRATAFSISNAKTQAWCSIAGLLRESLPDHWICKKSCAAVHSSSPLLPSSSAHRAPSEKKKRGGAVTRL